MEKRKKKRKEGRKEGRKKGKKEGKKEGKKGKKEGRKEARKEGRKEGKERKEISNISKYGCYGTNAVTLANGGKKVKEGMSHVTNENKKRKNKLEKKQM